VQGIKAKRILVSEAKEIKFCSLFSFFFRKICVWLCGKILKITCRKHSSNSHCLSQSMSFGVPRFCCSLVTKCWQHKHGSESMCKYTYTGQAITNFKVIVFTSKLKNDFGHTNNMKFNYLNLRYVTPCPFLSTCQRLEEACSSRHQASPRIILFLRNVANYSVTETASQPTRLQPSSTTFWKKFIFCWPCILLWFLVNDQRDAQFFPT
jgi:hypothetical protein